MKKHIINSLAAFYAKNLKRFLSVNMILPILIVFLVLILSTIKTYSQVINVSIQCNNPTICSGSCTQLIAVVTGASGTVNYIWTPGLPNNDTVNACPTTTTIYKVIVTDSLFNVDSAAITITVNLMPTVSPTNNIVVCGGTQINPGNFIVTPPGTTITWTNSNTAIGLAASGTGNIPPFTAPANVNGTNITGIINVIPSLNGCSGPVMSFTITVFPTFTVSVSTTNPNCPTCPDGNAVLIPNGGMPPYSYIWDTNPILNSAIVSGLLPGAYGFCVADVHGCVTCDTAFVSVGNCYSYFTLSPDSLIPHQYNAVNLASGSLPLSYLWSWGDGTTDTIAYPTHNYSTAGYYNVCLTIADSLGCTDIYCDSSYLQKNTNTMITINVIPPVMNASNEYSGSKALNIYPNPAKDHLTVEVTELIGNNLFSIYNIEGKPLIQQPLKQTKNGIDISGLSKGLYVIKFTNTDRFFVRKFIELGA
ncbi:MAG TPA: T9SS type A sorting domain-containing protein [Bacteroidales bacterium]|nr:T9SS type A sorting domain-containing protein [Bacteroidales bacterium]